MLEGGAYYRGSGDILWDEKQKWGGVGVSSIAAHLWLQPVGPFPMDHLFPKPDQADEGTQGACHDAAAVQAVRDHILRRKHVQW